MSHLPVLPASKAKAPHLAQGEFYEQLALNYLLERGLTMVARNYRCRYGELDLIMRDRNILVVVEVRYRKSATFGSAVESVTRRKQSRIITATQCYLAAHPTHCAIRFDVVAVTGNNAIEWITSAFQT
jgi:putative endonuclease